MWSNNVEREIRALIDAYIHVGTNTLKTITQNNVKCMQIIAGPW